VLAGIGVAVQALCGLTGRLVPPHTGAEGGGQRSQGSEAVGQAEQASLHHSTPLGRLGGQCHLLPAPRAAASAARAARL
jgi:hypothetical protein